MKTLAYFGSGPYKEAYEDLPYDRVYLIDYLFTRNDQIDSSKKVIQLGMDAFKAVDYFKSNGILIDCFVVLNEGLIEGGGSYPLNGDLFLGYIMPVLNDVYIHLWNPKYYRYARMGIKLDLPYSKERLNFNDFPFLSPHVFSDYSSVSKGNQIYKMKKLPLNISRASIGKTELSIIRDSIWNYEEELDLIGIPVRNTVQLEYLIENPKFICTVDRSIDEILSYASKRGFKKIGLCPWLNGNYEGVVESISAYSGSIEKIKLFYLNEFDYSTININYLD